MKHENKDLLDCSSPMQPTKKRRKRKNGEMGVDEKELEAYRLMLELKADEILFRAKHPVKYWIQRTINFFRYGDSTWDGANYSEEDKYKDGFSYVR